MNSKKNFFTDKIKSVLIISPDVELIKKTINAFCLIKKIDKNEYKKLFEKLKTIFITNKTGYTNEFFMPEKIWFTNKSMVKNSDDIWLASLLIHEAFHATQFDLKNNKYILPLNKLEKPALKIQEQFLKKAGDQKAEKNIKISLKKKYWIKMSEDKKSFAYFRNLLNLFETNKLNLKKII